jgi:hypothetical protein
MFSCTDKATDVLTFVTVILCLPTIWPMKHRKAKTHGNWGCGTYNRDDHLEELTERWNKELPLPLPAIQTRRLTNSGNPSIHQPEAIFLNKLPLELRRLIYMVVVGNETIQIVTRRADFKSMQPRKLTHYLSNERNFPPNWRHSSSGLLRQNTSLLSMAQACRQVYDQLGSSVRL